MTFGDTVLVCFGCGLTAADLSWEFMILTCPRCGDNDWGCLFRGIVALPSRYEDLNRRADNAIAFLAYHMWETFKIVPSVHATKQVVGGAIVPYQTYASSPYSPDEKSWEGALCRGVGWLIAMAGALNLHQKYKAVARHTIDIANTWLSVMHSLSRKYNDSPRMIPNIGMLYETAALIFDDEEASHIYEIARRMTILPREVLCFMGVGNSLVRFLRDNACMARRLE